MINTGHCVGTYKGKEIKGLKKGIAYEINIDTNQYSYLFIISDDEREISINYSSEISIRNNWEFAEDS